MISTTTTGSASGSVAGERTGDPFKDFELDLKKIESDSEAIKYIRLGRTATYTFIDLLYSTDW